MIKVVALAANARGPIIGAATPMIGAGGPIIEDNQCGWSSHQRHHFGDSCRQLVAKATILMVWSLDLWYCWLCWLSHWF